MKNKRSVRGRDAMFVCTNLLSVDSRSLVEIARDHDQAIAGAVIPRCCVRSGCGVR